MKQLLQIKTEKLKQFKKQKIVQFFFLLIFVTVSIEAQTAVAPSGSGTSGDPYLIATWENLYWITQNSGEWDKDYKQTADIDLGSASPAITTWDGGAGLTPIGSNPSFTGSYDGDGFTISGLFINRPSPINIGMFGYASTGSDIKNVGLINVNITGDLYVGGLVGLNFNGTIANSYSTGSVSGSGLVGGLVGANGDGGTISNSYSTCSVSIGSGSNVGGLVGENSSTITNSYFTGSVSGSGLVGGLVGLNFNGTIANSYSTGSVSGVDDVGGLVGFNFNNTITNSYSTGSVSGNSDVGGLVGENFNGTITNGFWDTQTSNQPTTGLGNGSSTGVTGKTTAEMKALATFTDISTPGLSSAWDFETNPNDDGADSNYWDIDLSGTINNGYPFLSWQDGGVVALPVELTSFAALVKGNAVELNWETATEINNYGFEIQRQSQKLKTGNQGNVTPSEDEGWETIGFVNGHGNSNSPKSYEFIDENVPPGTLAYRLKQIDTDGTYQYYDTTVEINGILTGTEELTQIVPSEFTLMQNYPNPFNPATTLRFGLPEESKVLVRIYNILGQEVEVLLNEVVKAGYHEKVWNASRLASGIYLYSIVAESVASDKKHATVKKMMLVK